MDILNKKSTVGELKISPEVIAAIARVAALEIEGVDSLAESTNIQGIFSRPVIKKAINVSLNDDFVNVGVSVNLKYGAKISDVCAAVQNSVKENVQNMTGMAVAKVNVLVVGIVFPEVNDN